MAVVKKGWLAKEGAGIASVLSKDKKRWFELRGDKLHYLKAEGGEEAGIIPIRGANIDDSKRGKTYFQISGPHLPREFLLSADAEADKVEWVKVLREAATGGAAAAAGGAGGGLGEDVGPDDMVFSREEAPGAPAKKVTLDDFELITVIGRGSFGKVLKVRLKGDPSAVPMAMKVMRKDVVVREEMVDNTKREKLILQQVTHPFIVRLHYAFQTRERLYLILDLLSGGELFFHLKESGSFSVPRARLYAAEITSALTHLHSKDVVYRDLKPENIVLDKDGHACLTDFGLAKTEISKQPTFTFCGTPEYLAPEILKGKGHGRGVDWWAMGCVLYEMLCGLPPFYSENVNEMYELILNKPLTFPTHVPDDAKDLLIQLIERDDKKRLSDGAKVMQHAFFRCIDWDRLNARGYAPEFVPDTKADDTKYVDQEFKGEIAGMSLVQAMSHLKLSDETFSGFTYVSKSKAGVAAK